jgi:protein TonB
MFADSMLETSWEQRTRRSWTTMTSFGLQAVAIAALLLVPLLTTVGLPTARTVSTPISAGRPDPGPVSRPHGPVSRAIPLIPFTGRIMAPGHVPPTVSRGDDSATQTGGGGGEGIGDMNLPIGPPSGFAMPFGGTRPIMPTLPPPVVRAFRTSNILEGSLIHRVQPVYPTPARNARVQGPVVLAAIIDRAGAIENLRTISGHPMLVPAAVNAVSQWRYRPFILNGEAIEVETRITVNFVLAGN